MVVSLPVKDQVRSSWSVYPQKWRKLPARANSTLVLIAPKKILCIFPWHENLSRVHFSARGFLRPLVIHACVHVGKIRLARETIPEAQPKVLCSITEKPLVVTNSLRPPVVRCLSGAKTPNHRCLSGAGDLADHRVGDKIKASAS